MPATHGRQIWRAALAGALAAAVLLPDAAPAQTGRSARAVRKPGPVPASARDRERQAYWAGLIDGYGATLERREFLPGGPYGPAFGYPPGRYAPQPSQGVDYTYAPWAGR